MKKQIGIVLCMAVLVLCSCGQKAPVDIIHHENPELKVRSDFSIDLGTISANMACDTLRQAPDSLGGFDPSEPIIECLVRQDPGGDEVEGFYNDGCLLRQMVRYAVERDGMIYLLDGPAMLKNAYAPVQTAEEALSFAVAVTGYFPQYNLKYREDYRYLTDRLEDTNVAYENDVFTMNLFYYQICGCGPHTTYSVEVKVTIDGDVTVGEMVPLYENPEEDSLCID